MTAYHKVHERLGLERGKARLQPCAICYGDAREWAYDNNDPNAVTDRHGRLYSVDVSHYLPLCKPCHTWFDQAVTPERWEKSIAHRFASKDTCLRGHPLTDEGDVYVDSRGSRHCRECRRIRKRRPKRDTCKRGHPISDETTYIAPGTPHIRRCRECLRINSERRRVKEKK